MYSFCFVCLFVLFWVLSSCLPCFTLSVCLSPSLSPSLTHTHTHTRTHIHTHTHTPTVKCCRKVLFYITGHDPKCVIGDQQWMKVCSFLMLPGLGFLWAGLGPHWWGQLSFCRCEQQHFSLVTHLSFVWGRYHLSIICLLVCKPAQFSTEFMIDAK